MASLDDQQKAKIKEWLRSLGTRGEGFACSMCRVGRLTEPSVITILPDSDNLRIVPLACNNCARVTFLDAERIGL